jgi:hypothetical protein
MFISFSKAVPPHAGQADNRFLDLVELEKRRPLPLPIEAEFTRVANVRLHAFLP